MKRRDWLQSVLGFVAMTLAGDRVLARYSSDKKPPTPTPPVAPPPAEVVQLGGYELQSTAYVPTDRPLAVELRNVAAHELEHAVGHCELPTGEVLRGPVYGREQTLVFTTNEETKVTLQIEDGSHQPILVGEAVIAMPTPQFETLRFGPDVFSRRVMDRAGRVRLSNVVLANLPAADRLLDGCKGRPLSLRVCETRPKQGKSFSMLIRDAYLDEYGWSVRSGEQTIVAHMAFQFMQAGAFAR